MPAHGQSFAHLAFMNPKSVSRGIKSEISKLDALYWFNSTALYVNGLATPAILYCGWNQIPLPFLIGWSVFLNCFSLLRAILSRQWASAKDSIRTKRDIYRWQALVFFTVVISGLCYGILGVATVMYVSGVNGITLSLIILSVSAGLVPSYASSVACSMGILFSSLAPWILACFASGETNYSVMGGLLAFYLYGNVRRARTWIDYSEDIRQLNSLLAEKEEKLLNALNSSGAVSWEWDLHSDRFHVEGKLEAIFGFHSPINTRKDFLALIHPEDCNILETEMDLATRRNLFESEVRVFQAGGGVRFINIRGRRILDEAGHVECLRGTCWNVTEKREQERVRYERDLLDAANKAKLLFLANASHEIRTPLAAIHGYAEMAMNLGNTTPSLQQDLSGILRNCKYLVSLVNDLLDLSKSETDNIYIQRSQMSLAQEIGDAIAVVQPIARRKGLFIDLRYENLIPEYIQSDPTRLRQILINLLSNSIKYTKVGGVHLKVAYRPGDDPQVKILIKDTGVGIDEGTRKNLFHPFVRGRDAERDRTPGSGLGLALSRSLARKLGGDLIHIPSSFGAEFELTLGVGIPSDSPLIDGNLPRSHSGASAADGSLQLLCGLRILVVDDDEDLRALMLRFLKGRGALAQGCADGAEAVSQAQQSPFDLILMDVKMPVMDGYEATKKLREAGYRRPIVAVTAHASQNDRQICAEAGFSNYVSKPVNSRELTEVILHELSICEARTQPSLIDNLN